MPFIGQQRHKKKARDFQATKKRYLRKCPEIMLRVRTTVMTIEMKKEQNSTGVTDRSLPMK